MAIPDDQSIRELARRVDAKDSEWFSDRYRAGDFEWAKGGLGPDVYGEMGRRIEMGDIGWVATALATLNLPGFDAAGPLLDMAPRPVVNDPRVAPVDDDDYDDDHEGITGEYDNSRKRRMALLLLPLLVILGVGGFLLTKCGSDSADGPENVDLVATAGRADNLSRWGSAVEGAGMTAALQAADPHTVFAPTNAAFDALGPETLDALFANKEVLGKVVNYHIVAGTKRARDLKAGPLVTLEGSPFAVTVEEGVKRVGGANLSAETISTNGVLHSIDKVLSPVNLAALGKGAIIASADESGGLTLSGTVGSEDAKKGLAGPLQAKLPGRVTDSLAVDPSGLTNGFTVNLVGRTRESAAQEIRAALASMADITVSDQLQVVPTPKLESDINALLKAEPIQFDSGSATIRAASNGTLDKLAGLLQATPAGSVRFDGHTDSAGSAARNLTLSQARADAVKAALVGRGVDAARLSAKGYGIQKPIADNNTPAGRQQNRRVEALVTP